ncbi:MAG: hypothetical protein GXX79_20155 [Actinomycetales bacterium]|nr:hypothetical protein [Actinomycetales bacterium]
MLIADLTHFQDLPFDAPGPARNLAAHLERIVRAATAGDAGDPWASALPCGRRPGRRPCPGRIVVQRREPPAAIEWRCDACGDDGAISGWEDTPYDLRRRHLAVAGTVHEVVIGDHVAAALRELMLLDPDNERLVYSLRAHPDGAALTATVRELEDLTCCVAAEANHDDNRRRHHRLDAAFTVLNDALTAMDR